MSKKPKRVRQSKKRTSNEGKKRRPVATRTRLNLRSKEVDQLFRYAAAVCRKRGFQDTDPEFASAINYGLYKALKVYDPDGPRKLKNLVVIFALRNCEKAANTLSLWHRQDRAGAERGGRSSPTEPPVDLTDFEVLCFVARHGRKRAALLLGWDHKKLRKLLDEIVLRVRNRGVGEES